MFYSKRDISDTTSYQQLVCTTEFNMESQKTLPFSLPLAPEYILLHNTHYMYLLLVCQSCNHNRPPVSKSLKAQHILQMLKDDLSYESQTRTQHSIIKMPLYPVCQQGSIILHSFPNSIFIDLRLPEVLVLSL